MNPQDFIGKLVLVERWVNDVFDHDFTGQVTDIHGKLFIVMDEYGNRFMVEPQQLKIKG